MKTRAAPQPAAALGRSGRWFTDSDGRVTILHGVNLVNKLPPYEPLALGFGERDAELIASWGFNTVRIGWIWKALEPAPGEYDDAYLERIAELAALLARHGQHVLLDFHQDMYNERFSGQGFPDWAVQDDGLPRRPDLGFPRNYFFMPGLWRAYDHFWANDPAPDGVGLQDRFALAWQRVAERLAGEPAVFYDVFNEPFPGRAAPLCAQPLGYPRFDRRLSEMSSRVLRAIRAVDADKLVLYEPNVLFNNGARTHHRSLDDPNTGLSFHVYCPATTPGMPRLRPGTAQDRFCAPAERRVLSNALRHAKRADCALLLSEFGATDDLRNIARVCAIADRSMISWQYWAYFNEDPSAARPEESLLRDLGRPRSAPNLDEAKAEVLSRPFPRAVAGTPLAYSFDPRLPEFRLSYAPSPAGGGRGPGEPTEVFLPLPVFGDDYAIELSGARLSPRQDDSELLLLEHDSGAERVDLRVRASASAAETRPAAQRDASGPPLLG